MTISYSGIGAVAEATSSITPALPGSAAAGELAVLQVVSAHTDASIPSAPSGWTLAGTLSGGGGTYGAGTGPRRLTWYTRVLLGGEADPTTALPAGDGDSVLAGRVVTLARSAGTGWRWAVTSGEDTSSGTGFSATAATALTWAPGDYAVVGYALPVSTAALSAEAVTAAGVTFGTITERADDAVTTGHDARLGIATGSVSSGTATTAPTVAATLSTAATGTAGVLRVREASADLQAAAQSVFPPRNLVSATGLAAEDITTVTMYRQVGSARDAVRATSDIDVTGSDVLLRVDGEQPFGVPVTYVAVLTDVTGARWEVTSDPLTSTVSSDVLSDAITGTGAAVRILAGLARKRDRAAAVLNAGGRLVVVSKARSTATSTITVETATDGAGDDLDAVLQGATEGVLLLRHRTQLTRLDGHYAIPADEEDPDWYGPHRRWTLDAIETEPWPDVLEAAGYTLQDIADNFTSLQDVADAFSPGTLLDIALHDFGE
ncbi:hypothetical protein OG393_31065 [Streptomyces sp. NBC_01216]|uniref:hypothetical protein n=1 Tax=Streptomyces sp. NBC_01216 TaxID=2903778 RepID=UPI002E107A94|nr:hypothetical protein OG393_31065 [Streptomyces sp. NBC_01216]